MFYVKHFRIKSSDRSVRGQQNLNLKVVRASKVKFGKKCLRLLGPKIWNRLPPHIKNAENLSAFKRLIKAWVAFCVSAMIYVEISESCTASDTVKTQVYVEVTYIYIVILLVGFETIVYCETSLGIPTLNKHIGSNQNLEL